MCVKHPELVQSSFPGSINFPFIFPGTGFLRCGVQALRHLPLPEEQCSGDLVFPRWVLSSESRSVNLPQFLLLSWELIPRPWDAASVCPAGEKGEPPVAG